MSRYELRVLLWSWGLMVDLDLTAEVVHDEPLDGIPIASRVWLVIPSSVSLWEGDLPRLVKGLQRVAPGFQGTMGGEGRQVVFVVNHLWYPLTDSQDDAIELAVARWAANELGMSSEPAEVSFDRSTNRYLIYFDEGMWLPRS